MLCFAVKALNWRTANVGLPFYFGATAPNQCEALLTIGSEIPIYCSFQAHLYLSATSNRINIFSPHFIESDAVHIPDPSYAHKFYTPMQSSG